MIMATSIIISALIVSVTALVALRLIQKSNERKAMIEKGLDPSLVNIYSKTSSRIFLYAGIFLFGGVLGILTGILLAGILKMPGETKELVILSIIIFTAISCFVCYQLSRNKTD